MARKSQKPIPVGASRERRSHLTYHGIGTVLIGLLLLANTGCLGAIILGAGAAAAGGAWAGYSYQNGKLFRDYPGDFAQAHAAVLTAMGEMGLVLLSHEQGDAGKETISTRTTDNAPVKIYLTTGVSPVPSDGAVTRIAVRVGVFGNDDVSRRILDQIGKHLAAPLPPAFVPSQPSAGIGPLQPVSGPTPVGETGPPPIKPVPVPTTRVGP
jgi:Protein of unknown function (DUF3568)